MHKLAHRFPHLAHTISLVLITSVVGCTTVSHPTRASVDIGPNRLGPDDILATNDAGDGFSLNLGSGQPWRLTATLGGQETVFEPGNCPDLDDRVDAFRAMPPLRPGPWASQSPPPSAILTLPPTVKDGRSWTIRTPAYAEDWSRLEITLEGNQGPYAIRANALMDAAYVCRRNQIAAKP